MNNSLRFPWIHDEHFSFKISNNHSFRVNNLSWRFWSYKQHTKKTYASSTSSQCSKFYLSDEEEEYKKERPIVNIKPVSLLTILLREEEKQCAPLRRCERYYDLDKLHENNSNIPPQ